MSIHSLPDQKRLFSPVAGSLPLVNFDTPSRERPREVAISIPEGQNPSTLEGAPKLNPGDDSDPKLSHVVPAINKKSADAENRGDEKVMGWGTGEATGELLYVEDAAEGNLLATEHYDKPAPVNLGIGQEIRTGDLVYLIKDLSGFEAEVKWDSTKPDGQPRRKLDTARAKAEFGFEAEVPLRTGLSRAIEWHQEHGGE